MLVLLILRIAFLSEADRLFQIGLLTAQELVPLLHLFELFDGGEVDRSDVVDPLSELLRLLPVRFALQLDHVVVDHDLGEAHPVALVHLLTELLPAELDLPELHRARAELLLEVVDLFSAQLERLVLLVDPAFFRLEGRPLGPDLALLLLEDDLEVLALALGGLDPLVDPAVLLGAVLDELL